MSLAAALLGVLLSLGSTRVDRVNSLQMMVAVALKLGGTGSPFEVTMQRCDPDWQKNLGAAAIRPPPD